MNGDHHRNTLRQEFLRQAGWERARLSWLDQDASTRRYARLTNLDSKTVILMDAPPIESPACTPDMSVAEREKAGWNAQTRLAASRVDAFVLIAKYLRERGLRPPDIYAHNTQHGFALIEDFGQHREFARLIERGEADEVQLYRRAAALLAKLQSEEPPKFLEDGKEKWPLLEFDRLALRVSADLFVEWLPKLDPRMKMKAGHWAAWNDARDILIDRAIKFPRRFTLRDFHAENLLLLDNGKIGLLDFQDALIGWDAWDMAMLTQDARRPVSDAARQAAIRSYLDHSGELEADFIERLSIIGTLNALRILGVFARLQIRDGKIRYRAFMPRQTSHLVRNLKHPATTSMAAFVKAHAPFIFGVRP